jgi:hypothetical protein
MTLARSLLAFWAEVGAAAGDGDFLDGRFADEAGLAGAPVDLVLELEEAAHAVGVDVVGDGRAAELDGVGQDFDVRRRESSARVTRAAWRRGRMAARKRASSA